MSSTNYFQTLIQIAPDSPVSEPQVPPARGKSPTVAQLQYELISNQLYVHTSDDVLFAVHAQRHAIPSDKQRAAREEFFTRDQACLRASPLPKRFGWGIHLNAEGRVALVSVGSAEYQRLSQDPEVKQLQAMRSARA